MGKALAFLKEHRVKVAAVVGVAAGLIAGQYGMVEALQKALEALK